jgi:glycosyltransferase involved in cell wall biosynthesis
LQQRYGVVHFGRRDEYQVAISLAEANALERLFTDFYTPGWLLVVSQRMAPALAQRFEKRHSALLDDRWTTSLIFRYLWIAHWRARYLNSAQVRRALDDMASECAARYVTRHPQIGMISYNSHWKALCAARASGRWDGPAIVFQVHPVAQQISRILREDRSRTGLSYSPEAEETQSRGDAEEYAASLRYADGIVVASEFTARGLVEVGVPSNMITTVPYGATTRGSSVADITEEPRWISGGSPLRLLWIGQLAYRKGAHHLFAALRHFSPAEVQLSLVTRSEMPAELRALMPPNVTILRSVPDSERERMYQTHHLFVLPSMIEGFGLVYLEALAAGLPILCTQNTGGADLISDGVEGFIVEAGQSDAITKRIEMCLHDPCLLPRMSASARQTASVWTWPKFRQGIRDCLAGFERTGSMQEAGRG